MGSGRDVPDGTVPRPNSYVYEPIARLENAWSGTSYLLIPIFASTSTDIHMLQQSTLTPPDTTSDGKTALHVAAESGRLSTVQILLRLQSNVLAQDFAGRTGLHLAVGSQQQDIVEELLNHPACLNIQDRNGQTALHIAAAHGYESIVTILLGAGAMLELKDARGQTPLHVAAANGQDEVLQLLFIRGANINATM
jgi:ankyrin repeat protein